MKKSSVGFKRLLSAITVLLVALVGSCKTNDVGSENEKQALTSFYPKTNNSGNASLALANRHESQYNTSLIPHAYSFPSNKEYIFVKYVITEDLYKNLEKGDVVLFPICISLYKTNNANQEDIKRLQMTSADLPHPSDHDVSGEEYIRNINRMVVDYNFCMQGNFGVYFKGFKPKDGERILTDLDLHEADGSETDINGLKEYCDYVASPTYLDRDLDILYFNDENEGRLEITSFYNPLFNPDITECPAFYAKYKKALECFDDFRDTFETIKTRFENNVA